MSQHKDADPGMALSQLPPTSDLLTSEPTTSNSAEKSSPHDSRKNGPPMQDSSTILTGKKLAFAFTGMLLGILLVALDQTILASALPKILTQFNALDQVTWVSGAFILSQAGTMSTFGQIVTLYPPKIVFLVCICVFEAGSVICGAAPNIQVLIFGRALAGAGAAGLQTSMATLMAEITTLEKRAPLMGLFGAVFGLASVIGPLIGGALADSAATWRWCFYINIPFGGIAFAAVTFLVKRSKPKSIKSGDTRNGVQRVLDIDWVGTVLVLGAITTLTLATVWGPSKGWSSASVVACLVVTGALTPVIGFWEMYLGERAMIPISIFKTGTFLPVLLNASSAKWMMLVPTYYLPIHFEVVRDHSATKAGLDLLGLVISLILTSMLTGIISRKIGSYKYFVIAGPMVTMIGAGLLFTIVPTTSFAKIIGFEIIVGVGVGTFFQLGMLAAQAEFAAKPWMMGKVMGVVGFGNTLGAIIGLAVSGSVFEQRLSAELHRFAPDVDPLVASSPTIIRQLATPEQLPGILWAYDQALRWTYFTIIPIAAIALLAALFIKNQPLAARSPSALKPAEVGSTKASAA